MPTVNTIEPHKATGRAPKRSIARPPKNWETHWPRAPGNMIRPLIVAEYPRSVWMYSGMMTRIELKAKNASDAVMVPTVNERFFSTSKSSSGGWGSADLSSATASR